jgi:hypothetical protein
MEIDEAEQSQRIAYVQKVKGFAIKEVREVS